MGKILVVFLCFFLHFAIVCGSSEFQEIQENPNLTSNWKSNTRENDSKTEFEKKMKEMEKLEEEFTDFKASLLELSYAVARFQHFVDGAEAETAVGKTAQAPEDQNQSPNQSGPKLPTSCSDILGEISTSPSLIKKIIYPHGNENQKSLEVLCDFKVDGGGWTLIQKRTGESRVDFNRTWSDYVEGFGSLDGSFWLGLDNIHALTQNRDEELRIELEDFEGEKRWAEYSHFSILDASDSYQLSIDGYSPESTAGDSMTHWFQFISNHDMKFTTFDNDNDNNFYGNCASVGGEWGGLFSAGWSGWAGGWWFNRCGASLNGPYREFDEQVQNNPGICWESGGFEIALAATEMKIRTKICPE